MIEALFENLPKTSVVYLLLAAAIGGLVGASLKLIFEVVLGGHIVHRREIARLLSKRKVPLVAAADSLASRIGNFLAFTGPKWLAESEYYRLSTYYIFCSYFAWIEILNQELIELQLSDSSAARALRRNLTLVEKAFNNSSYFRCGNYRQRDSGTGELPKLVCKALGELAIEEQDDGVRKCIAFTKFCRLAEEDDRFFKWIPRLQEFLSSANDQYGSAEWDRLHIIEIALMGLINGLDPRHMHSEKPSKEKLDRLLGRIREPFAKEVFLSDIAKWSVPIVLESREMRFNRKLRLSLRLSPVVRQFKRYSEYPRRGVDCVIVPGSRQLETGKGRYRLYKYVKRQLTQLASTMPYGVRINVVVEMGENQVADDILQRLPQNIADASGNRTRANWVQLKFARKSSLSVPNQFGVQQASQEDTMDGAPHT